jgi:tRNA A37 N6-isopentenylltransferase MiaA
MNGLSQLPGNEYRTMSFLEVIEAWLKSSSLLFTRQVNHDTENYTITHEMGSKWSTYLSPMLQTIFDDMGLNELIIKKSEDIVMFRIPLLVSRNEKYIIGPNR